MVHVDMLKAVNDSVDAGLKKAGMENTVENRVNVLYGMHKTLTNEDDKTPGTKLVLKTIEDEAIRLQLDLL